MQLRVNCIRIVALHLFVSRILNYVQQLRVQGSNSEAMSEHDLEDSLSRVEVSSYCL